MLEKLKSFLANDTLFQALLLILVAGVSFGLGRLSIQSGNEVKNVENKGNIEVSAHLPALPAAVAAATSTPEVKLVTPSDVSVVASKSGSKYHLPTCPGAKQIKPENLITFSSVAQAKAAGYTPAANCPGLP